VLSQDGLRGIARKQPQKQEQDDGEPEEDRDGPDHPPDDEPEHETTASLCEEPPEVPDLGGLALDA
jgi:hypothetical protein